MTVIEDPARGGLQDEGSPQRVASALEDELGLSLVESVLGTLGLPAVVVGRIRSVAEVARARQDDRLDRQSADELLDALYVMYGLQGQLEAASVDIARALSRQTSEQLMRKGGFSSAEEMKYQERRSWRRATKMAVAAELQALLGLGKQESYDMVALANSPAALRTAVTGGMDVRGARWSEARKFWDEAGDLEHEDATDLAQALFGDDPDRIVPERLDDAAPTDDEQDTEGDAPDADEGDAPDADEGDAPDGDETGGAGAGEGDGGAEAGDGRKVRDCPWQAAEFRRVLRREIAARQQASGEEAAHQRAKKKRALSISIGADGLSSLTLTGPTVEIMGMGQRIEVAARQLRREGDGRNLQTLEYTTAGALLQHGVIKPLADPHRATGGATDGAADRTADGTADGDLQPDQLLRYEKLEDIAAVLTAQPGVELQVITPLDALIGEDGLALLQGHLAAQGAGPQPVGEVLGSQSTFLTAEHLRELLLQPRSTLRRLVTDPVDGTLVHRELKSHAPDRKLKAFVRARDLMCKGPGCTRPAFYGDLDHVVPWPEGPTAPWNLNLDCRPQHLIKTYDLWQCVMTATGWVTWTTFFGRIYRTRPHDYRQYSPVLRRRPPEATADPSDPTGAADQTDAEAAPHPVPGTRGEGAEGAGADGTGADGTGAGGTVGPAPGDEPEMDVRELLLSGLVFQGMNADRAAYLAGRLIYAALSHRPPRSRLRVSDDGPWDNSVPDDRHDWLDTAPIRLRHVTPGGQRRHGPPPGQPTVEEILLEEGLVVRRSQDGDDPGQNGATHENEDAHRRPGDDPPPF